VLLGLFALYVLYSFAAAFAAATGSPPIDVVRTLAVPFIGFVVQTLAIVIAAVLVRPFSRSGQLHDVRWYVGTAAGLSIVGGALALPAFYLGGAIGILSGVLYLLVFIRNLRIPQATIPKRGISAPSPRQVLKLPAVRAHGVPAKPSAPYDPLFDIHRNRR
jgi:hypothetical protein